MRVSLQHVSHDYAPSETSAAVHVLDDVTLEIASGDFAVLMGASGSGKSTLLNLIGAVDRPTRGQVFLGETETSSLTEANLTELRRKSIGFVFQFFNLIPTLSVEENVAFPLALARVPKGQIDERTKAALAEVQLSARAKHYPNELSGGEMQRAALARAVIHRPSLLLADEPTGNVDSKTGSAILELIRSVHQSHRPTIVMATHSDVAASYGDYIVHVADGRVGR
ncbi:MAG TPA: ABC transporter ATP-binding protein [Thermoanaerobaculia bacterium]|nr:ABC transporter ATP-binding protein [Thermoanaerobaculia bacterium]